MQREYDRRFNVRRHEVQVWLEYLVANHPDYKAMTIDYGRLNQLPENDSILNKIQTKSLESPQNASSQSQNVGQGMFFCFLVDSSLIVLQIVTLRMPLRATSSMTTSLMRN